MPCPAAVPSLLEPTPSLECGSKRELRNLSLQDAHLKGPQSGSVPGNDRLPAAWIAKEEANATLFGCVYAPFTRAQVRGVVMGLGLRDSPSALSFHRLPW